jgi:hypothetical protein
MSTRIKTCPGIQNQTAFSSPLHPDPGEHALEGGVLGEPVASAAVGAPEVAHYVLVGDVREFLWVVVSGCVR